jgi:hypothetical protein
MRKMRLLHKELVAKPVVSQVSHSGVLALVIRPGLKTLRFSHRANIRAGMFLTA